MSDFGGIAGRIAGHLEEAAFEGGLRPQDIADILGSGHGESINLYPGVRGGGCHELAVFVSITSKENGGNRRGHLSCRKAIEKLVQHMQGSCAGITKYAVLVVDSWDGEAASEWLWNLRRIQTDAHLEVYLVAGGSVSPITV